MRTSEGDSPGCETRKYTAKHLSHPDEVGANHFVPTNRFWVKIDRRFSMTQSGATVGTPYLYVSQNNVKGMI